MFLMNTALTSKHAKLLNSLRFPKETTFELAKQFLLQAGVNNAAQAGTQLFDVNFKI